MSHPTLYVFAISHFCEKARFGLDYLGIDVELKHLPPGPHAQIARDLGVSGTSVPILVADGTAIQGSLEILSWAEAAPGSTSLTPASAREECFAVEKRLDDVAGVHARRAFYSEALIECPESVLPVFIQDLSSAEQEATSQAWPVITGMMIELMDLGPAQEKESTLVIDGELQWLDDLLADGRSFLVGDVFSRADITAASLLAPLVQPPEHPTCAAIQLPPRVQETVAGWRDRPSMEWVREIYRQFR